MQQAVWGVELVTPTPLQTSVGTFNIRNLYKYVLHIDLTIYYFNNTSIIFIRSVVLNVHKALHK